MTKPWTKCSGPGGTFYCKSLSAFSQANGLDTSHVYRSRKSGGSCHGWTFTIIEGDPPDDGVIWKKPKTPHSRGTAADEDRSIPETATPPQDPESVIDSVLGEQNIDFADLSPVEKYRAMSTLVMQMTYETATGKAEYPAGWRPKELTSVLESYAKAWDIDPKLAKDMRSDADKIVESAENLLRDGTRIFEQVDEVIAGLRTGFEQIHDHAELYLDKLMGESTRADDFLKVGDLLELDPSIEPGGPPGPKVIRRACRKWIDTLDEVQRMANLARQPCRDGVVRREQIIDKSTHTLRYQLYVGRPDISGPEGERSTYKFSQIHVRMSMRLWFMRVGAFLPFKGGVYLPGEYVPMWDKEMTHPIKYDLFLGMLPPRHGKTDWVIHDAALNINLRPTIQMAVIHDKEGEASKVLRATQRLFDLETAQGRRNARLYPGMRLADYDNNKTTLRVVSDNPPRNPNFIAATVWGSGQGNNLDIIYGDDLVPQSDMTEHNKREQRKVRFAGTWLTRLQGQHAHVVITGYPRHHEDLMWCYYTEAQLFSKTEGRQGSNIMALRIPVGGPQTNPKFYSIWNDMYPARELARRYKRQSDAALWAANYMLRPMTEDQKIVRSVRLVDFESVEMENFLQNATYYLSVDPAAKGDGAGDPAGVIVAALGNTTRVEDLGGGNQMIYEEPMLYIVHAEEFPATQTELTQHMIALTGKYDIDMALVEEVTGLGSAIRESLREYHGIDRVEPMPPRNKGKATRLRAVAPLLEHHDPNIPACVVFAGRRPIDEAGLPVDGVPLVPRDDMAHLISYVENFAVESGFHTLDCLTQLCGYLVDRGDLSSHRGQFARQAAKARSMEWAHKRKMSRFQEAISGSQTNPEYEYFGSENTPV